MFGDRTSLFSFKHLLFILLSFFYSNVSIAAVDLPAGELEFLQDTGNINLTGGFLRTMTIEGFLTGAVSDNFPGGFNLDNSPFFMNFLLTSSTSTGSGFFHTSGGGQFNIGGGTELNAVLSNLVIQSTLSNEHSLTASLSYIGGTLVPPGESVGSINLLFNGPVAGLDIPFSGDPAVVETLSGLVGSINVQEPAVIPIPAAFWLFSSALIGFVGLQRKFIQV